MSVDPATGTPLPQTPSSASSSSSTPSTSTTFPLASTKGYSASTWTEDPARHIFTARCRVIETSYEQQSAAGQAQEVLKADVVLEDPKTGELFAAAPYTDEAAVEPAVLGIGFEDRSDAFDFGVALQEVRKSVLAPGADADSASDPARAKEKKQAETRDLSLKEGETITVSFGGSKFQRRHRPRDDDSVPTGGDLSAFSLPRPQRCFKLLSLHRLVPTPPR
ncbi:unnamed protein product [Parascedosporium putredinis]|uniref:NECAP PHear domain-containing protein n=1 Tax=Parascedosporium putredinis TaxID=1442378 RepID=A0A9P1H6S2_9PEZI|nr:unnamed protein product [Parascedosporium putredinis]CAI7998908.1 unnamed protein product [Parascedosporium putredinis]